MPLSTGRKRFLFLLLLLVGNFCSGSLFAQEANKLPPFSMTLSSGRFFKAADLPKNKPVLLVYFAPDCDHCHTLMNQFFQKADAFKTAEVVMVTFKPVSDVRSFERAYQTARFSNIKVGTEGSSNFLRLFYRLQNTPFAALYNKRGELVASYRKDIRVEELIEKLKML